MNQNLKTIRENLGLTQLDVSNIIGIPINTIRNWEQDTRQPSEWVINLLIDRILREKNEEYEIIDESSGILSYLTIRKIISSTARKYDINRIYLFGSYAKGEATATSDIDLYMESSLYGLDYFEFIEILREHLNKKVEVYSQNTIKDDSRIDREIKKTGVIIYER